jgi:hypothetical protein
MGIVNATFSEPGAMPGQAKGWKLVSRCQAERWSAFGPAPVAAYEDFERWFHLQLSLGGAQVVLAFFGPRGEGHEGFDRRWGNDIYQRALSPALSVAGRFGAADAESFDWVARLRVAWADVIAAGALFQGGSQPAEWFESGWANDGFRRNWTLVPSAPALFGGLATETFAGAWPHAITL